MMTLSEKTRTYKVKFIFINLVTVAAFLIIFYSPITNERSDEYQYISDENDQQLLIVAHRGASGYAPENTTFSFDKALEMQADYIEIDVHMTKDKELVVIHDGSINRTSNGTGKIKNYTYGELVQFDYGGNFSEEFLGANILTLDEVLTSYLKKIGFVIEIKTPSKYPGIVEKVAFVIKKHNLNHSSEDIIVQSFNRGSLKQIKSLLPNVQTGLLFSRYKRKPSNRLLENISTYVDYVNLHWKKIDNNMVERVHAKGMKVMAWTILDSKEVPPLLQARVDGIITKYPDMLKN